MLPRAGDDRGSSRLLGRVVGILPPKWLILGLLLLFSRGLIHTVAGFRRIVRSYGAVLRG